MVSRTGNGLARFRTWALAAAGLALLVVVLGAYVRLSHAGLGCPDWPGCYGRLNVPAEPELIAAANAAFPERPVEVEKAWKEMLHRYLAGALALAIAGLGLAALRRRRRPGQPVVLPLALVGLVVFQALLGMWTVTLQLKPVVVMAHLLGGLATLALLWWLALPRLLQRGQTGVPRVAAYLALALLLAQVGLGGWTSANYASLACPDLPACQGQWLPPTDFGEAFTLWRGTGVSYEGGVLDNDARVTIHLTHRLGAMIVAGYVGWLAWRLTRRSASPPLRRTGWAAGALLALQVGLGLGNVALGLPLPVAVAHNGVAALLLLALIAVIHQLGRAPSTRPLQP